MNPLKLRINVTPFLSVFIFCLRFVVTEHLTTIVISQVSRTPNLAPVPRESAGIRAKNGIEYDTGIHEEYLMIFFPILVGCARFPQYHDRNRNARRNN